MINSIMANKSIQSSVKYSEHKKLYSNFTFLNPTTATTKVIVPKTQSPPQSYLRLPGRTEHVYSRHLN